MREILGEPEGTLRERWLQSRMALHMLSMLPMETYPKLYPGLRDYTRWLLKEKGNTEEIEEFEEQLVNAETYLKEKVESGELSVSEADVKRGNGIWWIAYEETHDAALYIALGIILERDILAYFKKEPAANNKTFDEIQEEVERKLVEKLRQFVDIDEV